MRLPVQVSAQLELPCESPTRLPTKYIFPSHIELADQAEVRIIV